MKAVVITSPGGPEVLQVQEVEDPAVGDDEVLIKVEAAALNRADTLQRQGLYPPPNGATPYLGFECSGTVLAVGRSVGRWKIGDQVCALLNQGGYAEKVVVPAGQVLPVPQGISLRDAASFPEVACTVWSTVFMTCRLSPGETFLVCALLNQGGYAEKVVVPTGHVFPVPQGISLRDAASFPEVACTVWSTVFMTCRLSPGETFLIHGGSSGIGTFAIQIAKHFGVRVFVTAGSKEKLAACKHFGADVCINYKTEDFVARVKEETGGKGVDVILDSIGGPYFQRNLDSLNIGGRLFIIGIQGGTVTEVNLSCMLARRLTVQAARLRNRSPENKAAIVEEVEKHVWLAIAAGEVKPVVYKTFPLSEAAEAHRLLESSAHIGKILLAP